MGTSIHRSGVERYLPKLPRIRGLGFWLDRLRATISRTSGYGLNIGLSTAAILLIGFGTSWYFVGQGIGFNTNRVGPWVEWPSAAQADADPYTRARIARLGMLPLSGRIAASYEARYDSEGQRLHSSCEYTIRSQALKTGWWSIAVYDGNGLLIPNAADRYGYDSATVITRPDSSFVISLAREARSGNWLPVGGAGRLTLVLTLLQPSRSEDEIASNTASGPGTAMDLPDIQRVSCR